MLRGDRKREELGARRERKQEELGVSRDNLGVVPKGLNEGSLA